MIYPVPKPRRRPKRKPRVMKRVRMKACGQRSKKSGRHLFAKPVDEARRAFVRTFPCAPCLNNGREQTSRTQACHFKARGAGGVDVGNLWPGCAHCHERQHLQGPVTFQRTERINLARICERIESEYVKQQRFVA